MDAIVTIWILTLVVALVVTVPVLAVVVRLVHHLAEIDRLARVTLQAAAGVAENTSTIGALPQLLNHATALALTAHAIDGVAAKIHEDALRVLRAVRGDR